MTISTPRSKVESALVVATAEGLHIPTQRGPVLQGRTIRSLAIEGQTVLALVDSMRVYRVTLTASVGRVSALDSEAATCVHVHQGTIMVGGVDAALWRLSGGELAPVESFLSAPTRPSWVLPWGDPPSVLSMASHGDELYVAVHGGGIMRSSDGGNSWVSTIDREADVQDVIADHDGIVWAATSKRGLAESADKGASWRYHTDGLPAAKTVAAAATSAGVLVAAACEGALQDELFIFDGSRFHDVEGLPDEPQTVYQGTVDEYRIRDSILPRTIAGSGDLCALVRAGVVFGSDDGGRRWKHIGEFTNVSAVALVPTSS